MGEKREGQKVRKGEHRVEREPNAKSTRKIQRKISSEKGQREREEIESQRESGRERRRD